jgi:hypothetical protein
MLTTFNEVNMQPVMELRKRYKDSFEKAHGPAGLHELLRQGLRRGAEALPGGERLHGRH